jgi:glycosyltransferase involved in cell wall biosynthesis
MWPSKRPEMLIDALTLLQKKRIDYTADFYGSPLSTTEAYYASLKEKVRVLGIESSVTFYPGPPNHEAPDIFHSHEIFVNCSPSGMFDKTLFEAAACGCRVLAASDDFAKLAGPESWFDSAEALAERIISAFNAPPLPVAPFVAEHSLTALAERLIEAL